MYYLKSKIYSDGSHYVAIPPSTNPTVRKPKPPEELVVVEEPLEDKDTNVENTVNMTDNLTEEAETENTAEKDKKSTKKRTATRTELFNELYKTSLDLPKRQRTNYITKHIAKYFPSEEQARIYVANKMEAKLKSIIAKKTRFLRKFNMNEFNYFVTFTYDDAKHDEISFRKGLMQCLGNYHSKKEWIYMGVWERAPKTKRLHFHCVMNIPDGTMPGEMIEKRDYSFGSRKMQTVIQNTYFNNRFGRTDFDELDRNIAKVENTATYILKYIEKDEEKIVYSRGIPMYRISDIDEDDVVCPCGLEDKKLLLFDNFTCIDDGEYLGTVSPEVLKQLPASN